MVVDRAPQVSETWGPGYVGPHDGRGPCWLIGSRFAELAKFAEHVRAGLLGLARGRSGSCTGGFCGYGILPGEEGAAKSKLHEYVLAVAAEAHLRTYHGCGLEARARSSGLERALLLLVELNRHSRWSKPVRAWRVDDRSGAN